MTSRSHLSSRQYKMGCAVAPCEAHYGLKIMKLNQINLSLLMLGFRWQHRAREVEAALRFLRQQG
jgi:hypothetical protein